MRKWLGILVAACLYYSGLVAVARWLQRRSGRRLIILNYHRANGGDLRRHLLHLRRHYRMMHLEEALQALYAPESENAAGGDRRTPLVLTFDDGYRDNYTHAFELARSLHVPITVFLVPGYIESGDYFWWWEGGRLVQWATAGEIVLEGRKYVLKRPEEAKQLAQRIDAHLRYATSVAERETFLAAVRAQLGVPETVLLADKGQLPLSWEEVKEMEQSGYVSFGAHTMHHPVLAYLKDSAEVRAEVSECRSVLEQQLGHPIRSFAYPIGRFEHIGEDAVQAVQEAGYAWAVTTVSGVNTPQSDPYRLKRVLGDVSRHWLVMAAEVSGLWSVLAPVWKSLIGKGESA
jgi:peptidoglycan/xylan/chitin deacetylase (PgdA/CDA1 family)